VFDRLAGTWTYWGWKGGYFDTEADARAFFDEMRYMLAAQMAAPNSPQWFNTGLHWAYGIDGPGQGHSTSTRTGKLTARSRPMSIRSRTPASSSRCRRPRQRGRHHGPVGARGAPVQIRLGHRLQLLPLRGEGEKLSGGGKSSGLMSFLKIGDRAAGAIKSGGTTRRAAKMVVVDVDHPDIEAYHRLEGEGGAEGRRPRHRLQDRQEAPEGHHEGLRQLRRARATIASTRRRTRR
jgi:ribonucleoside-diphosphate reductase alpha chain